MTVKSPTAPTAPTTGTATAPSTGRGPHLRPKAKTRATASIAPVSGPVSTEAAETAATPTHELSDKVITDLTDVFGLLSDASRLKILMALAKSGELHVSALCERLGTVTQPASQPAVSHHLTLLRMKNLVSFRREGKYNFYRLDSAGIGELLARLFPDAQNEGQTITVGDFAMTFEKA